MIRHGVAPFLECSSKGDKRFSAFYCKVNGVSIEEQYQKKKEFANGQTGQGWREAKGKRPINYEECVEFYNKLWRQYLKENPDLLYTLVEATGVSDIFGQVGCVCQSTVLWNLRNSFICTGEI